MAMALDSVNRSNSRLIEIDKLVRNVQIDVWSRRNELWNGNPPQNLIDVFEPSVALVDRGYSVKCVGSLGDTYVNGVKGEVAGVIGRNPRTVSISQRFALPIQRFTLAHELGHDVCHPGETGLHRDVSVEKAGQFRNWKEVEADRFASSFLMPERLVFRQFGECFRVECIELSEEMAYALCGVGEEQVRQQHKSLRGIAQLVAGAGQFNGRQFLPLASQFRVSRIAMAIRLEELELVRF
jgi:hypothetical protein